MEERRDNRRRRSLLVEPLWPPFPRVTPIVSPFIFCNLFPPPASTSVRRCFSFLFGGLYASLVQREDRYNAWQKAISPFENRSFLSSPPSRNEEPRRIPFFFDFPFVSFPFCFPFLSTESSRGILVGRFLSKLDATSTFVGLNCR